jgi:hypothetical protein
MSPGGTFDLLFNVTMRSKTIPKLADDGSNWIDYKTGVLGMIRRKHLMEHLEGRLCKPHEIKYLPEWNSAVTRWNANYRG